MKAHVVVVLAAVAASSAYAQRGFKDCGGPAGEMHLSKDELLKVNCDFAVALNPEAYKRLLDLRLTAAQLPALLDQNKKIRDQLLTEEQELIDKMKSVDEIQARYYAALKERYERLDQVTVESLENTRTSLRMARGARIASYLTSGMVGGIGGGLAGSQVGQGGGLKIGVGAAAGALLGVGLNWALLHFMGVQ